MKKILIISGISLLIIIVGLFITREYWIDIKNINFEPRDPVYEIPITYNIGWWTYQNALQIDTFAVDLIESRLSLFNSYSLIKYRIKGRLVYHKDDWEPFIDKIQINERILSSDSIHTDSNYVMSQKQLKDTTENGLVELYPDAMIEITPVIGVKERNSYKAGQIIYFDITNEHKIQSLHWGLNYITMKCKDYKQLITVQQVK